MTQLKLGHYYKFSFKHDRIQTWWLLDTYDKTRNEYRFIDVYEPKRIKLFDRKACVTTNHMVVSPKHIKESNPYILTPAEKKHRLVKLGYFYTFKNNTDWWQLIHIDRATYMYMFQDVQTSQTFTCLAISLARGQCNEVTDIRNPGNPPITKPKPSTAPTGCPPAPKGWYTVPSNSRHVTGQIMVSSGSLPHNESTNEGVGTVVKLESKKCTCDIKKSFWTSNWHNEDCSHATKN